MSVRAAVLSRHKAAPFRWSSWAMLTRLPDWSRRPVGWSINGRVQLTRGNITRHLRRLDSSSKITKGIESSLFRAGRKKARQGSSHYQGPVTVSAFRSTKIAPYLFPGGLMAMPSERTATLCTHCEKDIPTSNIELHHAYCFRNLQKCTICGDMVPKKHADEHYNDAHAPVDCSLCSETVPREVWSVHKGEKCPQRIVTCEYCEFPLPAVDLFKHQEICGNRTEYCHTCNKYVRLRERINHEIQFHSNSNGTAESSRDRTSERAGDHRRPARDASQSKILFTIAITGIAVLLGSIFLQRRADTQQQ